MVTGKLKPVDLTVDDGTLWYAMGSKTKEMPDACTRQLTNSVKQEVLSRVKPEYAYVIVHNINFRCGRIIAEALSRGERYAIVAATLGSDVDDLLRHYNDTDIVKAYIADLIASELAESASRMAISIIESTLLPGEKISNSYSPGYCGWPLTEQRILFGCFDSMPCGITLTESCMMLPRKSITSVLAIGTNVIKAPYGCEICNKKDCYKKRIR